MRYLKARGLGVPSVPSLCITDGVISGSSCEASVLLLRLFGVRLDESSSSGLCERVGGAAVFLAGRLPVFSCDTSTRDRHFSSFFFYIKKRSVSADSRK